MTHAELLRSHADTALREGGMYYSGEYLSRIASTAESLERENAKLRELVAAYQEVADFPICKLYDERKPDPFSGACAECDGEGCLIQCLNDELRELGVDV